MTQRYATIGVWFLPVAVGVTAIGSCGVHLPNWYYAGLAVGLTVYLARGRRRNGWRMDSLGNALLLLGVLVIALAATAPNLPGVWARASLLDRLCIAAILVVAAIVLAWAGLDSRSLLRRGRAQGRPSR